MGKTAFIFDLDGVIVDTAKYHYHAWKKLADELGVPFTEEDNENFKGVSRRRCLEILLEMGNIEMTEAEFEACLHRKNEDYLSFIRKMTKDEILPDVPRVLNYLKEHNIPMALGSASKNAVPILETVGLTSYFQTVVDGTKVTKAKPDPEVFERAAEHIGCAKKNCIVVEDAKAGIEAALRAGMRTIGIGDARVLGAADYVFKDFTEISTEFVAGLITNGHITDIENP